MTKNFDDLTPAERAKILQEALEDAVRESGGNTSVAPDNSTPRRVKNSEYGGDSGKNDHDQA